jgi:thiamine biosynthesis lipoprotein
MKKICYFLIIISFYRVIHAQEEAIYLEGYAQGTTYHIQYFDSKNRNLQKEIERLLKRFDASVSTYQTNSLISKINHNQKHGKTISKPF